MRRVANLLIASPANVVAAALLWSVALGCAAPATTANAGRPAGPTASSAGRDKSSPSADTEADTAYYRARATALAKEAPEEIAPTDFVRFRRGRLYLRDVADPDENGLTLKLGDAFGAENPAAVLEVSAAILAIDQADIRAHMLRAVALLDLHRQAEAVFHRNVAVGLIESILRTGDGRATKSAWTVYRVKEEYEVLKTLGCVPRGQALLSDGGRTFDRLDAEKVKGGQKIQVYFDITESFAERGRRLEEELSK